MVRHKIYGSTLKKIKRFGRATFCNYLHSVRHLPIHIIAMGLGCSTKTVHHDINTVKNNLEFRKEYSTWLDVRKVEKYQCGKAKNGKWLGYPKNRAKRCTWSYKGKINANIAYTLNKIWNTFQLFMKWVFTIAYYGLPISLQEALEYAESGDEPP